jgi:hypothetical protein
MVLEVGEIDELVKLEFPTYSGWVAQSDLGSLDPRDIDPQRM